VNAPQPPRTPAPGQDAVTDETRDFLIDLIQQSRHLRRVLLVTFGHGGGDNLTLTIHADMRFSPALDLLFPVFLAMPFALPTDLQPRPVDDHVNRSLGLPTICQPQFVNFLPHLHDRLTTNPACIIAGTIT
jgi:hypothetical protein